MRSASNRREGIEFSAIEREAEVFARELLMPERAVRRQFRLLFGVEQLRAGSALAAKYIPAARGGRSQDLRALASQIAGWSNSEQLSIASFFGVSVRSMSSRLIGLSLVY
jgi:hypothetical protein